MRTSKTKKNIIRKITHLNPTSSSGVSGLTGELAVVAAPPEGRDDAGTPPAWEARDAEE